MNNKIDYLIRLLGHQNQLARYRKAIADPERAIRDSTTKDAVAQLAKQLFNLVTSDEVMFQRLKVLLIRNKQESIDHQISEKALGSLVEKAIEFDVPLDVLVEVHRRGFEETGRNLPAEQNAFNRVNSFVSGGKALDLDRDLLQPEVVEEKTKTNPTLSLINRILKGSVSNPDNKGTKKKNGKTTSKK